MAFAARIAVLALVVLVAAPYSRAALVSSHVFSNHKGGCERPLLSMHEENAANSRCLSVGKFSGALGILSMRNETRENGER